MYYRSMNILAGSSKSVLTFDNNKVCLLFRTFEVLQKTRNPKNVTLYVGGLGPLDVLTNSTSVTKPV